VVPRSSRNDTRPFETLAIGARYRVTLWQ